MTTMHATQSCQHKLASQLLSLFSMLAAKLGKVSLIVGLITLALCGASHAATINLSCDSVHSHPEICRSVAEDWARKTNNEVHVVNAPNDSNERLAFYLGLLRSASDKIDIFEIDVIWPGLMANYFIDLRPYSKSVEKQFFPDMLANNTVNNRLIALPWYSDTGIMFYRKDLLKKYGFGLPKTWKELAVTAKKTQDAERAAGNLKMWGYVWQGRAYEGLTCNAMEWLGSYCGGTLIDENGKVTINNPHAIEALKTAASWIGSISPKAVLNYGEEESRGVFQSGNAVFVRHWPVVWAGSQRADSMVRGKVGVMALPTGSAAGRSTGALGGWQLAVSKYSKNQALAADLVNYLTSAEVQGPRAIRSSVNPTIMSLYSDPALVKANPFMAELYDSFATAVRRPSTVTGGKYDQVSALFWSATHEVLSGKKSADIALVELEAALNRLAPGGKWTAPALENP
ncbi:MAG: ABC transporter substrate-binding protein [Pseudomonadota bacterium]